MRTYSPYRFAYDFDLADRLRKSLRVVRLPVSEIAADLGVSRNTVSNWINGRSRPNEQQLQLWAAYAHAPLSWLKDGEAPPITGNASLSLRSTG